MTPSEERFWSLVSLQLAGEATPEDLQELADLLRDHPEWHLRLELYTNLYNSHPQSAPLAESHFSRHLQRLSNHLDTPPLKHEHPHRRRLFRPWMAAAAILLLAIAFIWLLKTTNNSEQDFNTVTTRPGSRSKLQLPDGTTVWLNSDSRLSYKVTNTTREVQLTGEAYFDVAKDKAHPFHVHTTTVDILVLGTAFDVRSYNNEHNTETSLFQGSVEVTLRNSPDKKIILHPEEKITVNNTEAIVTGIKTKRQPEPDADQPLLTLGKVHRQQADSSAIETLWTKNQLYFDDRSLEEIGLALEHWFGVRVNITSETLKQRHFSGNFEEKTLPEVMEALQFTGMLHYSIKNKEVTITP